MRHPQLSLEGLTKHLECDRIVIEMESIQWIAEELQRAVEEKQPREIEFQAKSESYEEQHHIDYMDELTMLFPEWAFQEIGSRDISGVADVTGEQWVTVQATQKTIEAEQTTG